MRDGVAPTPRQPLRCGGAPMISASREVLEHRDQVHRRHCSSDLPPQIVHHGVSRSPLTRHWFLRAPKQTRADEGTVVRKRSGYGHSVRAVQIADAPIELLEGILRCLSVTLQFSF